MYLSYNYIKNYTSIFLKREQEQSNPKKIYSVNNDLKNKSNSSAYDHDNFINDNKSKCKFRKIGWG